ncbi:MAG: phage portal protein, partial [Candidatus Saccharibacteria bacterium]|nr:phage portal protein [Candidatus Saccharibacteria bacterium]
RLYMLNPHSIYITADNSYTIQKYTYHTSDGIKEYNPEDVIHFKLLDPDNPVRGKSPVSAFVDVLTIDSLASKRHENSFKNASIPSGVLSSDSNLTPKQVEQVSARFQNQFAGVDNVSKIIIASGGFKFASLQPSVRDMELLQSRIFSKEAIQELYGISPALLGKTASTNKATAETEKIIFIENHVKPLQELVIRTLNHQLFQIEKSELKLELINPVPEDKELQVKMLNELTDKVITKNEARAILKLPPIAKGDDLMVQGVASQFLSEMTTRLEKSEEDYQVALKTGKFRGYEDGEAVFSYVADYSTQEGETANEQSD